MSTGIVILIIIILLLTLLKIYNALKTRWCISKVCLAGRTTIVTGSNTGIGYETALEFAKRGARVILACRDLEKAEKAKNRIISETENKNVLVKELNLSCLESVRNFATSIKETEERLDILVNNAGTGFIKHKYSKDGLQLLMQINYFGPFLLTILLMDLLKKSVPSRIVNVSSILAATSSDLTIENINRPPKKELYNYGNSKLANVLFTMKLAELLKESNVSVFSLHPGAVATDIFRRITGIQKLILNFFYHLYFKTPEAGAQTTLYAALEQGLEKYSGQHFTECARVTVYKTAKSPALKEGIWNKTIDILKCEKEVEEYLRPI